MAVLRITVCLGTSTKCPRKKKTPSATENVLAFVVAGAAVVPGATTIVAIVESLTAFLNSTPSPPVKVVAFNGEIIIAE